jgi:hypothetical protein
MSLVAVTVVPLWVSIVLALASPCVAAVAVYIGNRQQGASLKQQRQQLEQQADQFAETLRHERQRDDLSEVRSVLDDAALALHEADHRLSDLLGDIDNETKREALRLGIRAVDQLNERIAIRFGVSHIVTTTYEACAMEMDKIYPATQFPGTIGLSQRNRIFGGARDRFEALWPAFMDAATAYAGVELQARPPSEQSPNIAATANGPAASEGLPDT